ncbi:MAG: YhgE/Pip domain-containing protein [Acidimicrobiales bacterium]
MTAPEGTTTVELRAAQLLKEKGVWAFPLGIGSVLVVLMTLFYFGSIVDPTAHLHGLPVVVVDQDAGAATTSGRVDLGQQVVGALTKTPAVTDRLAVKVLSISQADAEMDKGAAYAAVVVPSGFTASVLAVAGGPAPAGATSSLPTVELMANTRAGTIGVSLAEGVLQPALADVSRTIGKHLEAEAAPGGTDRALLADPVTVATETYRPLPAHAGLGLSAFYLSLLIMMCGFLGATIVNTAVDSALGFATSEVGPRWSQKLPRRIARWQTLVAKWVIAVPATLLFTGLLMGMAAGLLRMDAPHWPELWAYGWFAAAVVAIGTLALFAVLGALGQLLALLVFVYLALASSGGTVPLQALPAFYRFVASFEPLRQIVGAVRAVLYFNGAGDAGLDRGLLLTSIGLGFWVVVGAAVTRWYDKKGLHRIEPELLEIIEESAHAYRDRAPGAGAAGSPPAAGLAGPEASGVEGP